MTTTITVERRGRRSYIMGTPYEAREALRAGGAHWDPDARAWWVGSADRATELAAALTVAETPKAETPKAPETVDPEDRVLIGRGTYQGRSCFVLGRVVRRGRTAYDRDEIAPVKTRDGSRVRCCARDGSRVWWADTAAVSVDKRYDRLQSIAGLQRFAERARSAEITLNGTGTPSEDGACGLCGRLVTGGRLHDCMED